MTEQKTPDEQLLDAIINGDKVKFDWALANGADVNANEGEPITLAAEHRRHAFAEKLLLNGATLFCPLIKAQDLRTQFSRIYNYEEDPFNPERKITKEDKKQAQELYKKWDAIRDTLDTYQGKINLLITERQARELGSIAESLKNANQLELLTSIDKTLKEALAPAHIAKTPGIG